ncbi:hypothetical protein [Pseudonocardia kunmingensis]|uniref:Uncharacterized protein n=1 Tax=Pseudonocardia kunmingensis TaxID=630975 RepID=A0A543DKH4_9PSEU|nr:hypothetical protein [Pseudonocardia kunmingensis]TQM09821.1 hypothetical protein FB558_5595 [Pseudonocardia kunmingensis]
MPGSAPRTVGLPLLAVAAAGTVVAAVAMDLLADEHPSHTAAVGLVAVVVAVLRLTLADRYEGVFSAVSGALVAQPALHATSKIGSGGGDHHPAGLLHVIASDGPATAMQVLVPALIVIAVTFSTQFLKLIGGALRRPLRLLPTSPPADQRAVRISVRSQPRGVALRSCGWAIRAARRGPPPLTAPAHA